MGRLADSQRAIPAAKRWVVKIGSSLVTDDGAGLDVAAIESWCAQCAALREQGVELVLVCSGAIAEGMVRLGMQSRPVSLAELQAAAAVGQMGVVQAWERGFAKHGVATAQVLLTHDDLIDRSRYLNARNALLKLISFGVIAVVNENDTIAIEEISLGDNDTLGALVANIVDAELLLILTDQDGLFDADPRSNPDAELISQANADDSAVIAMAGGSGALGRGGMRTKILAARRASQSGCVTAICNGRLPDVMTRLKAGEDIGTTLSADMPSLTAREQWLANHTQIAGRVVVDSQAKAELLTGSGGLSPAGVVSTEGDFTSGELIAIDDQEGLELGRGLSNYSGIQAEKIAGLTGEQIQDVLGGVQHQNVVNVDNMVVLVKE
jgi:glutamate 5-kinase